MKAQWKPGKTGDCGPITAPRTWTSWKARSVHTWPVSAKLGTKQIPISCYSSQLLSLLTPPSPSQPVHSPLFCHFTETQVYRITVTCSKVTRFASQYSTEGPRF